MHALDPSFSCTHAAPLPEKPATAVGLMFAVGARCKKKHQKKKIQNLFYIKPQNA
jgi:hypothetical protein